MTASLDSSTELALATGDPVVVGERQSSLLEIARGSNTSTDPWSLAADATAAAASALKLPFHGVGRVIGEAGSDISLKFRHAEQATAEAIVRFPMEPDRSAIGYALHVGRPVLVTDLDEELRFSDQLLGRRSIRSALIGPLAHEDQIFGVLGVFGVRPHEFEVDDIAYFELLSRLVSAALARNAAEQALHDQQRMTEKLIESTEALVVQLSPTLRIQSTNPAFQEASGFESVETVDRPFSSAVLHDDELHVVKRAIDRVRNGEEQVRFESDLVTKQGDHRRVAWSYTAVTRSDGAIESLVGTGVDITEKCEALERLEKVERVAKAATQRLDSLQKTIDAQKATAADSASRDEARAIAAQMEERRRKLRVPFPRMQEIAPIIDGKMPDRSRFLKVRCHDISGGGFSFFLPTKPDFEELVIALGEGPQRKFMIARVRHVHNAKFDGRRMKLVGCGYTARLELISNCEQGDYFVMTGTV